MSTESAKEILSSQSDNNNRKQNRRGSNSATQTAVSGPLATGKALFITLSLLFFAGCQTVSRSEYDAMKQGLETKIEMIVIIALILCVLIGVVNLFVGNIMGSKTLKDSQCQPEPEEKEVIK